MTQSPRTHRGSWKADLRSCILNPVPKVHKKIVDKMISKKEDSPLQVPAQSHLPNYDAESITPWSPSTNHIPWTLFCCLLRRYIYLRPTYVAFYNWPYNYTFICFINMNSVAETLHNQRQQHGSLRRRHHLRFFLSYSMTMTFRPRYHPGPTRWHTSGTIILRGSLSIKGKTSDSKLKTESFF